MLREKDGAATATRYDGPARQGRHGRPKPVGGRFRLPGFRFSGAAMAMSTVVGISVATTWLVSEQQSVGRLPGVTNVGASPPVPSPDTEPEAEVPADTGSTDRPQPGPSAVVPGPRALGTPAADPLTARPVGLGQSRPRTTPSASRTTAPSAPATRPAPVNVPSAAAPSATFGGTAGPSPVGVAPAASGTPAPSLTPAPSASPSPSPGGTKPGTPGPSGPPPLAPGTSPPAAEPLAGVAERGPLGSAGTRHTLELTVREELTALQVEFQLARPEALPGTLPWSTLPGAVVTVVQARGTVIYRFTLPPGLDVAPGRYLFAVHGMEPSPSASPTAGRPAEETWSASAFSVRHSEATTARGTFR
ncbi:hypothetical protein ACIRBX_27780 [Kitasatospora sp. NPDC096147]|uniref:hypothetical protein n=1 Tax=Kitasatospora sp. NPDC096147 TaxID=3364093 RepID=UPI00382A87F4